MSNKSSAKSGGISTLGLLGVVFVTLKLLGITAVATWSWWYVTMPFWGVLALVAAFFLIYVLFLVFVAIVAAICK